MRAVPATPDDIDFILRRMDAAGLVRYLGITRDGWFHWEWNKAFRDGVGGEHFALVLRDLLAALDGLPPLRLQDLRFIAEMAAMGGDGVDGGPEGDGEELAE